MSRVLPKFSPVPYKEEGEDVIFTGIKCRVNSPDGRWVCTREKGHAGDHIGGMRDRDGKTYWQKEGRWENNCEDTSPAPPTEKETIWTG